MLRLAPFLDKYDTVLFDMDGVITSEQQYWNSAALTVFEMLHSNKYFGNQPFDALDAEKNMNNIRKAVFFDDKLIALAKTMGVNSNWDLVYVVLSAALILETKSDFEKVYSYLSSIKSDDVFEIYTHLAQELAKKAGLTIEYCTRLQELWTTCSYVFIEWFYGSSLFEKCLNKVPNEKGKHGLFSKEEPIIPMKKLHELLSLLKDAGKRLGVGTGRPGVEALSPIDSWDIHKYFSDDAIIDYTYLSEVEKNLNLAERNINLVKPHPYMFLKGVFGKEYDDEKIISGDYDVLKCKKTLVVGDAASDMFSAFAAGCDFAAVLTGIEGKAAKSFFEKEGATYILDDVTCLMEDCV